MKSAHLAGAVVWLATLLACGRMPHAIGSATSIIVIAPDSLWHAIGDALSGALEQRVFTVRDEPTFEVTHVSPHDPRWARGREFRHVLVVGQPADPWVAPVLRSGAPDRKRASLPFLLQTRDVWARSQFATALVLPTERSAEAVLALTPRVAVATDSAFRAYARQRMYTSRPDISLRDSLRAHAGFGILLPNVYSAVRQTADLQLFQNSTQIGGDLVRSVLVVGRPGVLEPTVESALAWRDSIARAHYRPVQATDRGHLRAQQLTSHAHAVIELHGVWHGTDPTWPTAGPFITRMIPCPSLNRTFLVDTWLYSPAPQRGSRYEYLVQLQTILESFECVTARPVA
jgi:hypothetical protein